MRVVLVFGGLTLGCGTERGEPSSQAVAGSAAVNAFPCEDATAVVDETSGFLRCGNGLVVRSFTAECPSEAPRSEPVEGFDPARDLCQFDADCTDMPNGYCASAPSAVTGHHCFYGCTRDAECGPGQICSCGNPVGTCVEATCTTSDDCDEGFSCGFAETSDCSHNRFTCQRPEDSCASFLDCPTGDGGYHFCGISAQDPVRTCGGRCTPSASQ